MMDCRHNSLYRPAYVGDPVDVTSGANIDASAEFSLSGWPFFWRKYYNSLHHRWRRALGWGHTHEYDHRLQFDIDGLRYTGPEGEPIGFDALLSDGSTSKSGACRLTRKSQNAYSLSRPGEHDEFIFVFCAGVLVAPVSEIRAGARVLRFRYNDARHLAAIELADGRLVQVYCDTQGRIVALQLIGTDMRTAKSLASYEYDEAGNLIRGVDGYQNVFSFQYDDQNRMIKRTDRRGHSFLFEYDEQGWCVRSGGEDGVQEVRLRYLREERVTVVTRSDGGNWTYFYNGSRQITKIIDPLGGVRKFEFDDAGMPTGERDANDNITSYVYSGDGEPVAKISPIGIWYDFKSPPPPAYHPHRLPASAAEYEFGDLQPQAQSLRRSGITDPWLTPGAMRMLTDPLPSEYGDFVFDPLGHIVQQPARSGVVRHWGYDANGNLARYRDFSGATFTLEYGSWNHRVRQTNQLGHVIRTEFTKSEKLRAVTDAGGTEQRYSYNFCDSVTAVERHGQLLETYEYDRAGNLILKRDASGTVLLRFEILPRNLIGARHLASGDVQRFEYDAAGRFLRAQSQAADVRFEYDELGGCIKDMRDGRGVEHRCRFGELAETVLFGRFATQYQRSSDGALLIRDCIGATHRIWFPSSGVVARELSNGATEYSRFDDGGRNTARIVFHRRRGSRDWIRHHEWSPDGDLHRTDDSESGPVSWRYDAAHRLQEMSLPDGSRHPFRYDAGGNLLQAPGLTDVTMGSGNRLMAANGDSFEYNERDHIARRSGSRGSVRYEYDSRDMLVRVESENGRWEAKYDAIGRRVSKTVNGATTEYYWDTDHLAAEIEPSGRLRIYIYPDAFAIVPFLFVDYESIDADPASGVRRFLFMNHLGAPVRIEDDQGNRLWQCSYSPYGAVHIEPSSSIECNLRFPGHYFDAETGLHYNRFRYYSPELGRYLQCDPEGISGGLNLYAYTENPLVEVDIRGLQCPNHPEESDPNCQDCRNANRAAARSRPATPELPDVSKKNYDFRAWVDSRGYLHIVGTGKLGVPGNVKKHRNTTEQRAIAGGTGDDAGHMFRDEYGAPGEFPNLGRQNRNINRYVLKIHQDWVGGKGGSYYELERHWSNKLKSGTQIEAEVRDSYRISDVYPDGDSPDPGPLKMDELREHFLNSEPTPRPISRSVHWRETSPAQERSTHSVVWANPESPQTREIANAEPPEQPEPRPVTDLATRRRSR